MSSRGLTADAPCGPWWNPRKRAWLPDPATADPSLSSNWCRATSSPATSRLRLSITRTAWVRAIRVMLSRSRDVAGLLVALHQLDESDGSAVAGSGNQARLRGFHHGPHGASAVNPLELIGKALAALLEPYRSHLRRDPAVCARLLVAVVLTASRPTLAGPDPALTADDIVELFLDGVLNTKESSC